MTQASDNFIGFIAFLALLGWGFTFLAAIIWNGEKAIAAAICFAALSYMISNWE